MSSQHPSVAQQLRALLAAPHFPEDDDKTRTARLLHRIVLALVAIAATYVVIGPLLEPNLGAGYFGNAITLALYLYVIALIRRGQVRTASLIFAVLFWIAVVAVAVAYGGVITPALFSFFSSIVVAALLLGGRAALVFAILSGATSFILAVLDSQYLLPKALLTTSVFSMAWIAFVNFVMVAILLGLTVEGINNALTRARSELAERKRLEAVLQTYNQELEQMVEARTEQLSAAKAQIEVILNNINDGIIMVDAEGGIMRANPAFEALFGVRSSKAIEQILEAKATTAYEIAMNATPIVKLAVRQDNKMEAVMRDIQGKSVDVEIAVVPLEESGIVLISVHDISYFKQLDRFKKRFVANAVHDLSSPLSAITTRLYLLEKTPEQLQSHLSVLNRQVRQLRELISDLRILSEINQGGVILERILVNPNTLIEEVAENIRSICIEKDLSLKLSLNPSLPTMFLDKRKIERVVSNLLANAINYSPKGSEITILTTSESGSICIEVQDQGMGISASEMPNIFDRFYRSERVKQAAIAGTGLGLSIVKEMVEAHGGQVEVISEPDKGSTFKVRLPGHQV